MFKRLFVLLLVGGASVCVSAAETPLARFDVPEPAATELSPLLARVLDAELQEPPAEADVEDVERLLRRARTSALEVIATEGYFEARITAEPDPTGQARYVLNVTPGRRARVGQVEIEFRGAIEAQPDRIELLKRSWELAEGRPFRAEAWTASKTRLLNRVQQRDFPSADIVESEAEVNVDAALVLLRIVIDSGPLFTVGALSIRGLVHFDPELVQRYNTTQEGEPYDATKLLEFQRRLQASPFFSRVEIDVELDRERPERTPIRVVVIEAKRKRITIGTGFSTDTKFSLEGTYRQTQVFGYPVTLQTGAGVDSVRAIGYADLYLPPKPDGAIDSMGGLVERTDIENVVTSRWAIGAARDQARESDGVGIDTRLSLNFQHERRYVSGEADSNEVVNDVLSAMYSWTRRAVDSITHPRRGSVLTLAGALGLRVSDPFLWGYGRYVHYFELSPRDQVILRGELGHVVTDNPNDVPNEFLFRTGGAGSVRGYPYLSLGTKEGDAVLGSKSLVVGSAEYVRWLSDDWGAAVFYDIGDADDELWKVRWARGYGAGARWRTIAGPLAFDVAYGERDRRWRFQFSVAVAF